MEQFLNNVNAVKDCYSKHSYEEVMNMDKRSIQHLCLSERLTLNEYLHSDNMRTSNMVNERLNIIKQNNTNEANQRLEYLQGVWGKK